MKLGDLFYNPYQIDRDRIIEQQPTRDMNKIIKEIHDEFNTEVDRLLTSANIITADRAAIESQIDKADRLRQLGFRNSKHVTDIAKTEQRIKESQDTIDAITHFKNKYPLYKFITEDSVKRICQKYNLVYAPVHSYTGTVPDKNLKEIENFKIDEQDYCWLGSYYSFTQGTYETSYDSTRIANHQYYESPLEIVASRHDFDMRGKHVVDSRIESIPDPIVLQPIWYTKKHYLIVTAWGIEASDKDVINEKMN